MKMQQELWSYFRRLCKSMANLSLEIGNGMLNYDGALYSLKILMTFGLETPKIEASFLPTLGNYYLLGAGVHHVRLSLGEKTF